MVAPVLRIQSRVILPKPSRRVPGPRPPQTIYELEGHEAMLNELTLGRHTQVGSIVLWECVHRHPDGGYLVPGEMFDVFDYVICQRIPNKLWEAGGVVRPYKRAVPDVRVPRKTFMFFAGFEQRTFATPVRASARPWSSSPLQPLRSPMLLPPPPGPPPVDPPLTPSLRLSAPPLPELAPEFDYDWSDDEGMPGLEVVIKPGVESMPWSPLSPIHETCPAAAEQSHYEPVDPSLWDLS